MFAPLMGTCILPLQLLMKYSEFLTTILTKVDSILVVQHDISHTWLFHVVMNCRLLKAVVVLGTQLESEYELSYVHI